MISVEEVGQLFLNAAKQPHCEKTKGTLTSLAQLTNVPESSAIEITKAYQNQFEGFALLVKTFCALFDDAIPAHPFVLMAFHVAVSARVATLVREGVIEEGEDQEWLGKMSFLFAAGLTYCRVMGEPPTLEWMWAKYFAEGLPTFEALEAVWELSEGILFEPGVFYYE